MRIEGCVAIVTGAASGMGEATARYLADQDATVVLLDQNAEAVEGVAQDMGGLGLTCDVRDDQSAQAAVTRAVQDYGKPRILVNCAGIATAKRIVSRDGPMPLDEFRRVVEVNLIGTFNLIRLVAAQMMKLEPVDESGERGIIVNTASVAAYEGQIGQAAYSASKGGVVALTIQAARELASSGIRVMTIAPGLIDTPMLMGFTSEVRESLSAQVPFPKRFGKPQEYAGLVGHIIGNQMLNGEVIRLDGAIRMQPR